MTYIRYPAVRLSRALNGMKDGTHGTFPRVSDGGVPLLSAKNVTRDKLHISVSESYVSIEDAKEITAHGYPRKGDVLLTIVGTVGRSAVYEPEEPVPFQRSVAFLRPRPTVVSSKFLKYCLDSALFQDQLKGLTKTSAQPGVYLSDVSGSHIPLPSLEKQTRITDYLDHETAEIDAFITELETARGLATERHQARLLEILTGGTKHDDFSDSVNAGWFDRVPVGWTARKIRRLTHVARGASPRPIDDPIYFDPNGRYAWTRIADVTASGGRLKSTSQSLSDLGASLSVRLNPGELFVSIAASVGKPCITEIPACIHDGFVYFPQIGVYAEWLYYVFEAGLCYRGLGKLGTQLNLNTETVADIVIPVPPYEELDVLINDLDEETRDHRERQDQLDRAIELSRERRASLISAAVTGQIDVTPWHKPVAEAQEDEVRESV